MSVLLCQLAVFSSCQPNNTTAFPTIAQPFTQSLEAMYQLLEAAFYRAANATGSLAGPLEAFVLMVSAEMPYEVDRSTSLTGSWYLSPKQHGIELVLLNLIVLNFCYYYIKKALKSR